MTSETIFGGWDGLVRVVVVGILAYCSLVCLLRISGNRTLSQLNAFDLVVTVALGSTLATILLSKDVALVEGVTAFFLLVALQFAITWSSVRVPLVSRLVKSEPKLLVYRGELLADHLRQSRVTPAEVLAAVRKQGIPRIADIEAVVLETDGTITVLPITEHPATALGDMPDRAGLGDATDRPLAVIRP